MLIGLSGYARSGKDEAAWALCEYAGFKRVSFAAKLKDVLKDADPDVGALVDAEGWEGAKAHTSVRLKLQYLGVSVRQHLGEDTWVDAALRDLLPGRNYVFTDTRFPNEAQAIKDRGGRIIRVTRPSVRPVNGHISETALDDWPFDDMIWNNLDVPKLHERILAMVV